MDIYHNVKVLLRLKDNAYMFVCLYSGDKHILAVYIFLLPEPAGANTIRSSPPTNWDFVVA